MHYGLHLFVDAVVIRLVNIRFDEFWFHLRVLSSIDFVMGDISGTLYFNAPGFRSDSVDIAPAIGELKTKRKPLIEKEVS